MDLLLILSGTMTLAASGQSPATPATYAGARPAGAVTGVQGTAACVPPFSLPRARRPNAPRRNCLAALPAAIALTAEQRAKIAVIRNAFLAANATDFAAVRKMRSDARAARQAGKSPDEIKAILVQAKPALQRIRASQKIARTALAGVLGPRQKVWIARHRPSPGTP